MSEFFESEVEVIELPTSTSTRTSISTLSKKFYESMSGTVVPEGPIIYSSVKRKNGLWFDKTIFTVSTIAAGFTQDPGSRVYVVAYRYGVKMPQIQNLEELDNITGPDILYNNRNKTCTTDFDARVNYKYNTYDIEIDLNFAFKEKFEVYILRFVPFHLSNLYQQLLRV